MNHYYHVEIQKEPAVNVNIIIVWNSVISYPGWVACCIDNWPYSLIV